MRKINNTKENSMNYFKKGRLQRFKIPLMLWFVGFVSAERQEMRGGWSLWTLQDGGQRRCLPKLQCGINRELRPCSIDGEKDRCVDCPAGKINMDPTSSYTYFPCYREPVCPEGTVKDPDPSPSSISCNPRCRCDPLQGWVGLDSCLCTKVDYECGHDTFLNKDGHCTACPEGTHKPGLGYGPCLNATKTGLSPKTTTTKPTTSSPVAPTTTASSSATNDSSSVKKEQSYVIEPDTASDSDKTVLLIHDENKGYPDYRVLIGVVVAMGVFIPCVVFVSICKKTAFVVKIQKINFCSTERRDTVQNSVDARFPILVTETGSGSSSYLLPRGPDHTEPKVYDV